MVGYISEFQYYGATSEEFIEVALPEGTDPSGYEVAIYDSLGSYLYSFPLGVSTGTMAGQDVYVIDQFTPGFGDGGADPTGRLYPEDAVALVDGDGNVVQFISYWGNTVTAVDGAAVGMTSTDVGTADLGESLQSDDGGSSYYTQTNTNSGSIPACYAPGSLIATPGGAKPVDQLLAGDLVLTASGGTRAVRWVWSGEQPLEEVAPDKKPVLIRGGALGTNLPAQDLIVSGQHRIVVGAYGQLEDFFGTPLMVPAKALTDLPGVRFMAGKRSITWHHFLCDDHSVVFANDLASETLLLGSVVVRSLSRGQLAELSQSLGRSITPKTVEQTAVPCLKVRETRRILQEPMHRKPRTTVNTDRFEYRLSA